MNCARWRKEIATLRKKYRVYLLPRRKENGERVLARCRKTAQIVTRGQRPNGEEVLRAIETSATPVVYDGLNSKGEYPHGPRQQPATRARRAPRHDTTHRIKAIRTSSHMAFLRVGSNRPSTHTQLSGLLNMAVLMRVMHRRRRVQKLSTPRVLFHHL